ncbi:MAG: ABC transporter ATP-binding protein [Paralcaligenes sp.]
MPSSSDLTTLQVEQVEKSYGLKKVLHEIDFVVEPGQVVSLLGQSGCGKTTLLRLIAGFDRPDSGQISVARQVVASARVFVVAEKRHIGYVPQEGALFPHLNVYDNVAFGLNKGPGRSEAVDRMLELTGITELRAHMPHQLSGGQQQRVALARALAPEPRMLLLDEPFNALDANLRSSICQDVMTLLRRIGATVLLVTHDQREAFISSDRVAVMRDGHIVQFDDPVNLYRRPVDVQTAELVGGIILLDGVVVDNGVRTALGMVPVASSRNPGESISSSHSPRAVHRGLGESVRVMLRPEQLRLVAPGQGVAARVVEIAFHGQYFSLRIVLESPDCPIQPTAARKDGATPTIDFLVRTHYPLEHTVGDRVGVRIVGTGMLYGLRDAPV